MSYISKLITKQLLANLDEDFHKHPTDVQSLIISEALNLGKDFVAWAESKTKDKLTLDKSTYE